MVFRNGTGGNEGEKNIENTIQHNISNDENNINIEPKTEGKEIEQPIENSEGGSPRATISIEE